jgi:hypothetical protein
MTRADRGQQQQVVGSPPGFLARRASLCKGEVYSDSGAGVGSVWAQVQVQLTHFPYPTTSAAAPPLALSLSYHDTLAWLGRLDSHVPECVLILSVSFPFVF